MEAEQCRHIADAAPVGRKVLPLPGAGTITIFDSSIHISRQFSEGVRHLDARLIDMSEGGDAAERLLPHASASIGTVTGMTRWSDFTRLRKRLEGMGKRLRYQSRVEQTNADRDAPFVWIMA